MNANERARARENVRFAAQAARMGASKMVGPDRTNQAGVMSDVGRVVKSLADAIDLLADVSEAQEQGRDPEGT